MASGDFVRPLDVDLLNIRPLGVNLLGVAASRAELIFNWSPRSALTLPGSTFSRASVAKYNDSADVLQEAASGVLRDAHFQSDGTRSARLEAARTNLLTRAEEFDHADWLKSTMSVVADDDTAPDGTSTADKISNIGKGTNVSIRQSGGVNASSKTWTVSIWLKAGSAHTCTLQLDDNSVLIGAIESVSVTTSWQRFTITRTAGAGLGNIQFQWYPGEKAVAEGEVHAWGAQLEEGAFVSSYIKTVAASATRVVDSLSYDFLHAPQAMTVYAKFVERGTLALGGSKRVAQVGNGQASGSYSLLFARVSLTQYQWGANDDAGSFKLIVTPGTIALGDVVELRGILEPDTNKLYTQSAINGIVQSESSQVDAGTISASFRDAKLFINSEDANNPGFSDFIALKVARGVRSMPAMRAA